MLDAVRMQRPEGAIDPLEQALSSALDTFATGPLALASVTAAARTVCERGGKRIRPRLCLLAYEGAARTPPPPSVVRFAAGIEILHAFMLVHDDLIDEAECRRGGPSVHVAIEAALPRGAPRRFARDLALLAGDMLFAAAIRTMSSSGVPSARCQRAMDVVLEHSTDAAFGECLDVLHAARGIGEISLDDLEDALRRKTAGYSFVAPLVAGAVLGGAPASTCEALVTFGERLGVAFQLADDVLDLFGDPTCTGKPAAADVRQRKRTVLIRTAFDRACVEDRLTLASILDTGDVDDDDVRWVTSLVMRTGAVTEVAGKVRRLVGGAVRALESAALEPQASRALGALAGEVAASVSAFERRDR